MPSAPPGLPVPLAPVLARVTLAWRAGHDIDTLRQALLAEGWLERASGLQAFDVTGDGRPEWLVTVAPPDSVLSLPALPDGRQGVFWIVNDSGLAYAVGRSEALWLSAPEVVTVADFTGDDVYDVVVEATGCGAHTCFQHYQVISAQGGSLRDVVRQKDRPPGETHVIAISSSEPATADETGDGVYDFVIHGGAAGSAGAGIHRRFTEIWSWDGSMMVLAERRMDFSDYRHHLLYDANAAFDAGRLDVAQAAYVRVIEDVTLQDSPAFVPGDPTSYEDSRAFAAFRLCLVGLLRGDYELAERWSAWLRETYPERPLTAAVAQLVDTWQGTGGDGTAACAAVRALLEPEAYPAGTLSYLGYGNPAIGLDAICPLS